MFHPFVNDLSDLRDSEVESKLLEVTKKYHAAARLGKIDLLTQLGTFVTIYREEMSKRYLRKNQGQTDTDLDQLINVD